MLAGVRNRWGQTPEAELRSDTTAAFASVAEVDVTPSASPSQQPPDQATGAITGAINGVDPEGAPLSYAITGTLPTAGSVSLNPTTGAFTYTPTQAARLAAGTTAGADLDAFTVAVGDGTNTTPVTVSVAVLPATISTVSSSAQTGVNPMGIAVSPTKTYVVNQASNTVSVIDRANPAATPVTIAVATSPRAIALSQDGTRAYVAGTNQISVINTATNTVIATVAKSGGDSYGIAVSPNGQRLYVTNAVTNTVSVFNTTTATPTPIANVAIGGYTTAGLAVSPDGTRLYVTNYNSNSVRIIDTATNTVLGNPITVGANPFGIAVAPDGTKLYVTNNTGNSVSVINNPGAPNQTVSTIAVGTQPFGIAISPDGSLLYAANANDTVSIINTKTNTVIRTLTIDTQPENQWHHIALSPDGRTIYVSDMADRTVRILTITRANTPPTAGTPTVGTPDGNTGAVTGLLNVTDPDGDTLTYTVPGQPTSGTVTVTTTGTYTYTPTQAARQQAAQTPGPDTATFTINATDGQATTSTAVTVPILASAPPANRAPVAGTPSVGIPDRATGTVTGSLNFTDPDNNSLSYRVPTQPASGTVTVNANGTFGFTPTPAARAAALASPGPDSLSITVTATDGEFTTPVTFTVPILPANQAPVAGTPSVGTPNAATGAVTGALNFTDPDGDALTYSAAQPTSGTISVTAAGGYTFTPTQAARDAAALTPGTDSVVVTLTASDGLLSTPVSFTVPIAPTPPIDQAPSASPTQQPPDQATGAITGAINGVDPEGATLSYAITGTMPTSGSVTVNPTTGAFTYTPTQAARLAAATATVGDAFTVAVGDGTNTTPVTVSVAVLPATISTVSSSAQTGVNPMGIAVSPTKTYVVNQASNTVSVIDRANPAATPVTIAVATSPRAIALSQDGTRAYVAGNTAVSVINTATNTVIATVAKSGGDSYGIAVSPVVTDGFHRVYVTNAGNNTVSLINANTTTNSYTNGGAVVLGQSTPTGVTVSPDGSRVYVANYGSKSVSVISTVINEVVGSPITVGANPFGIAVAPDGTKLYVTNNTGNSVSVINNPGAPNQAESTIAVGTQPFGIAISPDGSLLYAANANDTVSIINTKTNTVIRTLTIDTQPENQWHHIALSPDGRTIYVSDMADRTVRIFTITRANTPPTAGTPTVGTPDVNTAAVTGVLNVTDPDGDTLTYTVPGQPTSGTVTVTTTGTYTYTPTQAARQQAAQTPGPDTATFTINATDGQATTPISVTVPITPSAAAPIGTSVAPIGSGVSVTGDPVVARSVVSADGTRAVLVTPVTSGGTKTTRVAVINVATGQQVGATLTLAGGAPSTVISADSTRATITTSSIDATGVATTRVTVINTVNGAQIGTTLSLTGSSNGNYVVGADGGRTLITSSATSPTTGSSTRVAVINTVTGAQIGTTLTLSGSLNDTQLLGKDGSGALITTSTGNTTQLSVINTTTGAQVGTSLTIAGSFTGTTLYGTNGNRALIATSTTGPTNGTITQLSVINTTTCTQLGTTVALPGRLNSTQLLGADGSRVLVAATTTTGPTNGLATQLAVLDTATGTQVGTTVALAGSLTSATPVGTNGGRALIATSTAPTTGTATQLSVLDTATGTQVGTTVTLTGSLTNLNVSGTDGSRAVITTLSYDSLYDTRTHVTRVGVIDTVSGAQAGTTVALNGGPRELVVSPDGAHALITAEISGTSDWQLNKMRVALIDTATGAQIGTTLVGQNIYTSLGATARFTADGTRVLLTSHSGDSTTGTTTVSMISTSTGAPIGTAFTLPGETWDVLVSPDGTRAVITAYRLGRTSVAVVDTTTGTRVGATSTLAGDVTNAAYSQFTADGSRVVIAHPVYRAGNGSLAEKDLRVAVFNVATGQQVGPAVTVAGALVTGPPMLTANDTRALLVTDVFDAQTQTYSTRVTVIDTVTDQPVGTTLIIAYRVDYRPVLLSANGTHALLAYAANGSTRLVVINTLTGAQTASTTVSGALVDQPRITAGGTRVLITTAVANSSASYTTRLSVLQIG